jgi:spoIIIJ-associated protein
MKEKEKDIKIIQEYLQGMLDIIGEISHVEVRSQGREFFANLVGVRIFEGKDQKTLSSLEYLTELYLKRKLRRELRVHIDVASYKERRVEELRKFALKVAEEVCREHKRVRLNPMESWERKAIHEALSDFEGIRTYSEGGSGERRVVIEPV